MNSNSSFAMDTKELIITLSGGEKNKNGTMKLCYELSWKAQ